jgi:branched-chain amino acid aminotransferase
MIGSAAALGVQMPKEALLFIVMAPFPKLDGPKPGEQLKSGMKLLASQGDMVRAWPGGFGYAKVGANYGPTLVALGEAKAQGYDQVLWLFGKDGDVTEAGACNFFIVWKTRDGRLQLVTAPLDDKIILDGVTRKSVLDLARQRLEDASSNLEKLEVVERNFTMTEVEEAVHEGRVVEAFAAGTAVSHDTLSLF